MKIGPTFYSELVAAGVGDAPIVWNGDGVQFGADIDPDTRARVCAVITAHNPARELPVVIVVPKIDLWRRMTDAEHVAMKQGVAGQSQRIQDIFNDCQTFRSDAAEWELLQAMATQLYGPQRAAELLAP